MSFLKSCPCRTSKALAHVLFFCWHEYSKKIIHLLKEMAPNRCWKEKVFLERKKKMDFFFLSKNRDYFLFQADGGLRARPPSLALLSPMRTLWRVHPTPTRLAGVPPVASAPRTNCPLLISSKGRRCAESLCGCCPGHARYRGHAARTTIAARLLSPSAPNTLLIRGSRCAREKLAPARPPRPGF